MKVYFNSITKNSNYYNNNTTEHRKNLTPVQTGDRIEFSHTRNRNLSFKASFLKHIAAGISAGAAAGATIGAKGGGVIDLSTAGGTLGIPTATGATVGSILGGITGAIGGTVSYFTSKSREEIKKAAAEEAKKLKKDKEEIEQKMEALKKQQESADVKNAEVFNKQKEQLDEMKKQTEILEKFSTKKFKETHGVGLGRVAGYNEDKQFLNAIFISPYKKSFNPETRNEALNIPNGVLLYGTSGNGKTTLAEGIIEELMNTTESVYHNLSNLKRSDLENELCKIKEEALQAWENENKRTIIFIDEFDGFAPNMNILRRAMTANDIENPTNSYLKSFMNDCAKYGITIIATTNYPRNIEKPFIDNDKRFSVRTAIEPPKAEDIKQILNYYLEGVTDDTVDLEKITEVLVKKIDKDKAMFSCSKIEKLAERAKEKAKKDKRLVSQEDLLKIAEKTNPNIDSSDISEFKKDFEFIANMTYEEYLEEKAEQQESFEE